MAEEVKRLTEQEQKEWVRGYPYSAAFTQGVVHRLSLAAAQVARLEGELRQATGRAEAAEGRLKYHHASYPLPKKPPQPVQLGDDYNPDLCRFCREADWEAPAEAQARQKEGSE